MSAMSTQYILVPIEGRDDNGIINPTTFPVEFAFLPQDTTPSALTTWHAGTWYTVSQDFLPNIYKAAILIGPSTAVVLTPGSWDVWIRITHAVEQPVEKAATILII
jgi:hypothetical protein